MPIIRTARGSPRIVCGAPVSPGTPRTPGVQMISRGYGKRYRGAVETRRRASHTPPPKSNRAAMERLAEESVGAAATLEHVKLALHTSPALHTPEVRSVPGLGLSPSRWQHGWLRPPQSTHPPMPGSGHMRPGQQVASLSHGTTSTHIARTTLGAPATTNINATTRPAITRHSAMRASFNMRAAYHKSAKLFNAHLPCVMRAPLLPIPRGTFSAACECRPGVHRATRNRRQGRQIAQDSVPLASLGRRS